MTGTTRKVSWQWNIWLTLIVNKKKNSRLYTASCTMYVCNQCIIKIPSSSQVNKSIENHYPSNETDIVADERSITSKTCILCGYDGSGLKSA